MDNYYNNIATALENIAICIRANTTAEHQSIAKLEELTAAVKECSGRMKYIDQAFDQDNQCSLQYWMEQINHTISGVQYGIDRIDRQIRDERDELFSNSFKNIAKDAVRSLDFIEDHMDTLDCINDNLCVAIDLGDKGHTLCDDALEVKPSTIGAVTSFRNVGEENSMRVRSKNYFDWGCVRFTAGTTGNDLDAEDVESVIEFESLDTEDDDIHIVTGDNAVRITFTGDQLDQLIGGLRFMADCLEEDKHGRPAPVPCND